MSTRVLLQETRRGRICECPLDRPVIVGSDQAPEVFRLRDKHAEPRHCELTALIDGSVQVRPLAGGVHINDRMVQGAGVLYPSSVLRIGSSELRVLGILDETKPKRTKGLLSVPQDLPPHYLLLRVVGHGAAGVVYEAYDRSEDRRVAIKVLIAGGRAVPELVARFQREAELQARLRDYPGIVSVYETGIVPDSGELFAVMEYVSGSTLRDTFYGGKVPRKELLRLVARVARAADYAHKHGLIHRDLKPANVMVSEKGVIRLTDFGLCKALEQEDGLTATGVMLGTPSFMAPEQIDDSKTVDRRADVYSLGASLYCALTGRLAFQGNNIRALLEQVLVGEFARPREVDESIAPEMEALCLEAMSLLPKHRPASAMELAKRIEAWLKQVDPPTRITLRPPGA